MVAERTGDLHTATLPPELNSVAAARHLTDDVLHAYGFDEGAIERAGLLVSELATNAVLHARTPLRVGVRRCANGVRVEVRDDDPHRPPPPYLPDGHAVSGRGMALVAALATTWGVNGNERGKTVWFEV